MNEIITVEGIRMIEEEINTVLNNNSESLNIDRSNIEDSTDIRIDDKIVAVENMKERDILLSRCTFKNSYLGGEKNNEVCINKIKKCLIFIIPWREFGIGEFSTLDNQAQLSIDLIELSYYILKLFIRNRTRLKTEYLQLHIGYYKDFQFIKKEIWA